MSETENAAESSKDLQQPPASITDEERAVIESVPATFRGMPPTAQTFFAVVNANGSLNRGFGVASSTRLALGQYQVLFSHDVTGSAYVATLGLSGSVGGSPPGEIAVVGRNGNPNGVFVQTFNSAGGAADRGFHLSVLS
ncbi:hypothetical protein O7627_07475 [Solwaraspora sp. WMMD1047]|uniref:hypothetical protein n=1 Tax=Solwaraspora sp. WMMD1047 TaxID=3016102 RepID=UPI002417BC49|nr:hypothetical protein [Solwaraspora sp. WMMD1047]MDG4829145.1 hypothetical protein [Solwaraspora sp. WMMD1047]